LKTLAFPTTIHKQAADAIIDYFSRQSQIQTVLIVNSCARGVAIPESDLDIAVLTEPGLNTEGLRTLELKWLKYYAENPIFAQLKHMGSFSGVHLDFFDGQWTPEHWDEGGGPDSFEIEIGNRVAYAVPVWERTTAFTEIRSRWLPYYSKFLQKERISMVTGSCRHNIERLQFYVQRGLYFQAFDRLYHAFQEFLQALFIAHRMYPIAYNKWIREQVEDWLGLPLLYAELPSVFQLSHLESPELVDKGKHVLRLLETWAIPITQSK